MAVPIKFPGCNLNLIAPTNSENVRPMYAFTNGVSTISCWKLTSIEYDYVFREGKVWVSVLGSNIPPMCVADEEGIRSLNADYGLWKK